MTAFAASAQRSAPGETPPQPKVASPTQPLVLDATHKTIVLLVEDNHINRLFVKQALTGAPIQLLEAHDGAQFLDIADEFHPDLILMDVSMPVMNGLEATRRLRERERACNLPPATIVGVTAHAMPADRCRCIEAGMDDYISKPVDPAQPQAVVARLQSQHKAAA